METEQEKQAHKELHKAISECNTCCPISPGERYCDKCAGEILGFLNKYGAGVLTRDEHFEDMEIYCKGINECNDRQVVTISELRFEIKELKQELKLL